MNQEYKSSKTELTHLLNMFLRGLRRMWLAGLILCLALGAWFGFRAWRNYVPTYTASATFTVYSTSALQSTSQTYNTATAEQMAKTFPHILTSGVLSRIIMDDLGVSSLPQISASAVDESNFLDLKVTGRDPQFCYDVLQSLIENYPQVAEMVVGPTILELVDESGVPETPVNARSWVRPAQKGVLIGILISVAAMLGYGYVKSTVMDRSDMESASNARYLGGLPQVVRKRRTSGVSHPITLGEEGNRSYRESFRLITVRVEKYPRKCYSSEGEVFIDDKFDWEAEDKPAAGLRFAKETMMTGATKWVLAYPYLHPVEAFTPLSCFDISKPELNGPYLSEVGTELFLVYIDSITMVDGDTCITISALNNQYKFDEQGRMCYEVDTYSINGREKSLIYEYTFY